MASLLKRIDKLQARRRGTLVTISQILAWADEHHAATGRWPVTTSGRIGQSRFGETWRRIDGDLKRGVYGSPGLSLAMLLHQRRGKKLSVDAEKARSSGETRRTPRAAHVGDRELLSVEEIVAWADMHHAATGRWPTADSGPIAGVSGDNWRTVASALIEGRRGLPGGTTLSSLLMEHRGRLAQNRAPDLTVEQILKWADDYYGYHAHWPSERRGLVSGAPGETWRGINRRLRFGGRGLPGGSSLPRLIKEQRGPRKPSTPPDLDIAQILTWADAHHAAKGNWPTNRSGKVRDAPWESWKVIDEALRNGWRGLAGGTTLARLLDEHRPQRCRRVLTREKILAWADAHRAATGDWPSSKSGAVAGVPGETWSGIDHALRNGFRALPSGWTLARLVGRPGAHPRDRLTRRQIRTWGRAYHAATGRWPRRTSGAIPGAPGETWETINRALRFGGRGLRHGMSLVKFFARERAYAAKRASAEKQASAEKRAATAKREREKATMRRKLARRARRNKRAREVRRQGR